MRFARVLLAATLVIGVAGCSEYESTRDDCSTQADCNPGKTCGDMIQCVDGSCDPDKVINLECSKLCQKDEGCPQGMHCRKPDGDGEGECVADGTCADVAECRDLPHDACLGSWVCTDGRCAWSCLDLTTCSDSADCVLADKDCCCGSGVDDYVAVRGDKLAEWNGREECRGVDCPFIECNVPATIAASCLEGQCQVIKAGDLDTCELDADCTVVTEGCCPCFDYRDQPYTSVRADRVNDWYGREECGDVQCERCFRGLDHAPEACWHDTCVRAACGPNGRCTLDRADPFDCERDADCERTELACPSCGCADGYREGAVNGSWRTPYDAYTEFACMAAGACAPGPFGTNACTNRPGVCVEGRCDVLGQSCPDCLDVWHPLCVLTPDDGLHTFPNSCQSTCAWDGQVHTAVYPGRCECQMDCDCWDEYGCTACASNGETYHCSYSEIACNGLDPLYPGTCDPDCDYCGALGRLPVQACGEHFFTYAEYCYAECLGRDYWHLGACEPGEGAICATSGGIPCPNDELFCLLADDSPGSSGRCIQLGACLEPAHCEGQPLETPPCPGHWDCQDHACTWICG